MTHDFAYSKLTAYFKILQSSQTVYEKRDALMDAVRQIKSVREGARDKCATTMDELMINYANLLVDCVLLL